MQVCRPTPDYGNTQVFNYSFMAACNDPPAAKLVQENVYTNDGYHKVRRCRLSVSKPVLNAPMVSAKAPMVSALEAIMP